MDKWRKYKIADIALSMADAPFGSYLKNVDYTTTGAVVVQGKNIQGRVSDWSDLRFVSYSKYDSLSRSHCFVGDLIFPKVGTIGKVGILTPYLEQDKYVLSTNTMLLRPNPALADNLYLYYYFSWDNTVNLIQAMNSNSVQPVFNFTSLKNFVVTLPSLEEQRIIANILGALDDKIELNRRMNDTLEGMAHALFKSWFVDFDPVKARAAGQPPVGVDEATASLFPASFTASVLGPIPEGWKVGTLADITHILMGQSPPGDTYNETEQGLPFYQGTRDFGFRFPSRRIYCSDPTRIAEKGDVLLSVRAPVGELNIAFEKCAIGRGVSSLRHKNGYNSYLYYLMQAKNDGWDKFNADGTVFGSVSKEDVYRFSIILVPQSLVERFNDFASKTDALIEANEVSIRTLTAIRDSLLPRLISGELRVPQAMLEAQAALDANSVVSEAQPPLLGPTQSDNPMLR